MLLFLLGIDHVTFSLGRKREKWTFIVYVYMTFYVSQYFIRKREIRDYIHIIQSVQKIARLIIYLSNLK